MPTSRNIAALKRFLLLPALFLVFLPGTPNAIAETRTVSATIDTSKTGAPISKYIYGQFLEHGGDIVNTGVWSEMLVDRKFFFPVATTAPTPPPVMGMRRGIRGSAARPRGGGPLLAAMTLSSRTPNRPTPETTRRWSN